MAPRDPWPGSMPLKESVATQRRSSTKTLDHGDEGQSQCVCLLCLKNPTGILTTMMDYGVQLLAPLNQLSISFPERESWEWDRTYMTPAPSLPRRRHARQPRVTSGSGTRPGTPATPSSRAGSHRTWNQEMVWHAAEAPRCPPCPQPRLPANSQCLLSGGARWPLAWCPEGGERA